MTEIESLREQVAKATEDNPATMAPVAVALLGVGWSHRPENQRLSNFYDARAWTDFALALVERKLPGWSWQLRTEEHHENGFRAELWCSWGPTAYQRHEAIGCKSVPLAILSALLAALSQEEPGRT